MAAPAQIDDGVVLRLVAAQLETLTGVAVRHLGEDEREGDRYTVRLAAMTIDPDARNVASDYEDAGAIELTLMATCTSAATASSVAAIGALVALVCKTLDGQVLRDAGTTHEVQLRRCRREYASDPDPDRQVRAALITVSGRVHRKTGDTLDSSLMP